MNIGQVGTKYALDNLEAYREGCRQTIKNFQKRLLEKSYCARQDCEGCPYENYEDCTSHVKIISVHIEDINDIADEMLKEVGND